MAENNDMPVAEEEAPKKTPRPKPDYSKDPNVAKRLNAGKRSSNRNAGKPLEDGIAEVPDAPAEGGIVAEAQDELAAVTAEAEKAESEAPAEEAATEPSESTETPAEEASEGEETPETAIEQFAEEEAKEPEHQESGAIEQFAEEEAQEPEHQQPMVESSEYSAPEGPAHDELIDKYHEALAFGDMEQAKELYKQLQEHRYAENMHRTTSEANAKKAAQEFLDTAMELAAKYPQLAEDGLEADKVLALKDVYWQSGLSESEALRKAVADLFPEAPKMEEPAPAMEPELPVEEPVAAVEEPAPVAEPEAPVEEPAKLPDMSERVSKKRKLAEVPSASARNEPPPPVVAPTRTDAIQKMKQQRGQA